MDIERERERTVVKARKVIERGKSTRAPFEVHVQTRNRQADRATFYRPTVSRPVTDRLTEIHPRLNEAKEKSRGAATLTITTVTTAATTYSALPLSLPFTTSYPPSPELVSIRTFRNISEINRSARIISHAAIESCHVVDAPLRSDVTGRIRQYRPTDGRTSAVPLLYKLALYAKGGETRCPNDRRR